LTRRRALRRWLTAPACRAASQHNAGQLDDLLGDDE
jgi:hypothetical protein